MEFFEVVNTRRSVRAYKNKEIEKEKLHTILETANKAPSAGNLQAYQIFVVRDQEKKVALAKASFGQEFVAEAPVALIFCAHPELSSHKYGSRGADLYAVQDATIAATHVQLAATALGLATCWVGAFDDDEVLAILGGPRGLVPVCILPLGYPAENPESKGRRPFSSIVHEL